MIGAERPLARATAANLGLSHAKGRYLLFLDDDDLLLPDHIGKLVNAFLDGHDSLAAYTGVRLENAAGATLKILDDPYDPARLRGANFLPIHAVLFDCALVEMGCRFDEELECLEAVSYTHLDVYKRQTLNMPRSVANRLRTWLDSAVMFMQNRAP